VLIASVIALFLGIIIVIVTKIFAVPVDKKLEDIKAILPGANCGACGFTGCEGYAQSMADGSTDTNKCPVGGIEVTQELSRYLGVEAPDFVPKVAHIYCQGTTDHTSKRFDYKGTMGCTAAHGLFSGPNSCTYGCLGFGDCAAVCQFDAIYIHKGIAFIDSSKCTACGMCVATCPKNLISIIPKHGDAVTVKCKNKWPGAQTRKNCTVGCIGCQKCFKVCEYGAITMDGPLAVIDQEKCTQCGACIPVCPTHAIDSGLMLGLGADGNPDSTVVLAVSSPAEAEAVRPGL
jgi:Na+-translocating ferredoxin:NAD+ oxidoreductase RNF subunit RnfB